MCSNDARSVADCDRTLASVGAAIILLSLPLDLFFQQIVSYPAKALIDSTSNATISRGIFFDPRQDDYYIPGEGWGGGELTSLDGLLAPFLFGNGTKTAGVQFNCPTGNCTYDSFYTLSADYSCTELPSTFLEFGCKNTSAEWLSSVNYEGPRTSPNVTSCGFYMNVPNNPPQLMSGYEITANGSVGEILASRSFALSDVFTNEQFFGGSLKYKDVQNPIVDFIIASTPNRFEGARQNSTPVVHECEIHWVVKKVQSKVESGVLTEEALETLQFESQVATPWDPEDSIVYQASFSMELDDPHSVMPNKKSTFGMSNDTARSVWQNWALYHPFTETLPTDDNPISSIPVIKYAWLSNHIRKLYAEVPYDVPHNVTEVIGAQVRVMNEFVRENESSASLSQEVSVGTAIRYVVIVHIRWVWITLPAALLLFSLIFLTATVHKKAVEFAPSSFINTSPSKFLDLKPHGSPTVLYSPIRSSAARQITHSFKSIFDNTNIPVNIS